MEEARSRNSEDAGSDSTLRHPFNTRAASRNFPNLSELSDISMCNKSENRIGNFRRHRKIDVSKKGEPSEKRRNFPMYRNLSTWRTYFTVIHTGNLFRHIASLVLRHPVWMTGFSVNSSYSVAIAIMALKVSLLHPFEHSKGKANILCCARKGRP
jgi:hypothetical protein